MNVPEPLEPPLVLRARLGAALVAARGAQGLSISQLSALDGRWTAAELRCIERGEFRLSAPVLDELATIYQLAPRWICSDDWRGVLDRSSSYGTDGYARLAAAVTADEPIPDARDLAERYLSIRNLLTGRTDTDLVAPELGLVGEAAGTAPTKLAGLLAGGRALDAAVRAESLRVAGRAVVPHCGVLVGSGPGGAVLMTQRSAAPQVGRGGRGSRRAPVGPLGAFAATVSA
ncbi:MAG: hypothetical protein R2754_06035 [Microthrixaceae bacterium]